jgi:Ca2+-binding RTX toxin-like protein
MEGKHGAGRIRRALRLALVGPALSLLCATGASAARVEVATSGAVEVRAVRGETNRVTVASAPANPDAVLLDDAGAPLEAGRGCTPQAGAVRCQVSSGAFLVDVRLGDSRDRLDASGLDRDLRLIALGGDGDDAIRGGDGSDFLSGAGRADHLIGGMGADELLGGTGNDRMLGGDGSDRLLGGRGDDTALGGNDRDRYLDVQAESGDDRVVGGPGADAAFYFCRVCRVSIDGRPNDGRPGERDDLAVEDVQLSLASFSQETEEFTYLRPGRTTLLGNRETNVLEASGGEDLLIGGDGKDILLARGGDDRIRAADGRADLVACGNGRDIALVDPIDTTVDCERIRPD